MENVNLHELPRKELKQLCNEHNIRTAGVKHDDLVRLLRHKLYPPAPDRPRLPKTRSQTGSQTSTDSQTSSKNRGEFAETTSTRSTSQGRTQRSLVFADDPAQDNAPERSRRELSPNPALIRKPILTKSNSTPARRSDFLRKKVNTLSGLDKKSQEGQPQQSDGSPIKGRSVIGARRPSIRSTSMVVNRPGERLSVKVNGAQKPQNDADAHSEAASSPRTSEGGASVAAVDSSDICSPSFRSVSEIASDAGHYVMSEDSDIDDGRSVSSEPASRFSSQTSKLAPRMSTGSKLGRTVLPWDSGHERDSLESSATNNEFHEQNLDVSAAHGGEDIFSYFLENADSLVGDTDGLDSFLDTTTDDPEDIKRADGHDFDLEQFRTSETSTAHYQESDIVDCKGSMREELDIIHNNKAALTDGLPESLPGDRWLVDYETAHNSERAGAVDTNAALPPPESAARTEILNSSSNGSLPVEKPHGVVDGDSDIAPLSIESPGHSLEYESAIEPVTISELVEDISFTLDSTPDILDHRLEAIETAGQCEIEATVEDPEHLPAVELSFLGDGLSSSGKEMSNEVSDDLPDSGHVEEEDHDSRGLEVTWNSRFSDKGVPGVEIAKSNEVRSEMLVASREISEHAQAATPPLVLVSEEIDGVEDSSEHEGSRVVVASPFLDSEIASPGDFETGISVGDASCTTPHSIPDAKLTPSEPVEDRADVKWSFVSALYDDLEDANNTDDMDGYGVLEHMLAESGESGESGSGLIRDIEPLTHLKVHESDVANHAGTSTADIERHGVVVEGNESDGNIAQDRELILNEIASMSVEQAEVEYIFQNGSRGTALLKLDSEVEHEGTRSDLSVLSDLDSSRVPDVHHECGVMLSVSQHCIEPFICSVDKVEGEESTNPDTLLRSSADDVSGANYSVRVEDKSKSVSQTQQTSEDFREENIPAGVNFQTSAEVEEETETWNTASDDKKLFIEALPLAESSTSLTDHESRMPSSQEQDGVCLHGEKQSLVPGSASDELELSSHDNTVATSQPRKLQQIFTVGLKMILVIGTVTLGILKFRASRLRLGEKR